MSATHTVTAATLAVRACAEAEHACRAVGNVAMHTLAIQLLELAVAEAYPDVAAREVMRAYFVGEPIVSAVAMLRASAPAS